MDQLPPFIRRFGLEAGATERDLKRAYARELKKIDPQADPAGFQSLREARDAAQSWLRYQAWARQQEAVSAQGEEVAGKADDEGTGADPVDRATPAGSSPEALAGPRAPPHASADGAAGAASSSVSAQTATRSPAETQLPGELAEAVYRELHGQIAGQTVPIPRMRELLEKCLDDPRLLFIEAREIFEYLIVQQLAQGWRTGHEVLFDVAYNRFGWQNERQRLVRFGQAGAVLERAMQELSAYQTQSDETQGGQLLAMRGLRDSERPEGDNRLAKVVRAEQFAERFPCLAAVVTNLENLKRWRQYHPDTARAKAQLEQQEKQKQKQKPRAGAGHTPSRWWIFLVVMVVINAGRFFSPSKLPEYQPPAYHPPSVDLQEAFGSRPEAGATNPSSSTSPAFPLSFPATSKPSPVISAPPVYTPFPREEIVRLSTSPRNPATCQRAEEIVRVHGTTLITADETLSPDFDRLMVECSNAKLWSAGYLDPQVQAASRRNVARLQSDTVRLSNEAQKLNPR